MRIPGKNRRPDRANLGIPPGPHQRLQRIRTHFSVGIGDDHPCPGRVAKSQVQLRRLARMLGGDDDRALVAPRPGFRDLTMEPSVEAPSTTIIRSRSRA